MRAVVVALAVLAAPFVASDVPPPLPYAAAATAPSSGYPAAYDDTYQTYTSTGAAAPTADHGFNIQSGFEGYLIPHKTVLVPIRDGLEYLSSSTGLARVVKFISAKGLRIIPKLALGLVGAVAVLAVGCVVTTAICTFTPLCNIHFHGWGVARESMRSLLTEDRISATAAFVTEAIRKYQEMYAAAERKSSQQQQQQQQQQQTNAKK